MDNSFTALLIENLLQTHTAATKRKKKKKKIESTLDSHFHSINIAVAKEPALYELYIVCYTV